ncbi:hypothetical protein C0991_003364 [Blastosporella zonata]|nr:hypothetical protein C0991_003364 [Blastosporella zonata]
MATFVQGSSRMAPDNPYILAQTSIAHYGSEMVNRDNHSLAFGSGTLDVSEDRTVAPPLDISENPVRDPLDDLIQDLEGLSLFGRTKAQYVNPYESRVFLDPCLRKTDVQFSEYREITWDGRSDVVPVISLLDLKGINVLPLSFPRFEDTSVPPDRSPHPVSFESLPDPEQTFSLDAAASIAYEGGQMNDGFGDRDEIPPANTFPVAADIPFTHYQQVVPGELLRSSTDTELESLLELGEKSQEEFFAEFLTLFDLSDPVPSQPSVGEKTPQNIFTSHSTTSEELCVNPSHLTINPPQQTNTQNEPVSAVSFDFRPPLIRNEEAPATPSFIRSTDNSLNNALGTSPLEYPFPEIPACITLSFPITNPNPAPISPASQDFERLFNQTTDDVCYPLSYNHSLESFPSLSPSFTDSSTLDTPTDNQSPTCLSFMSPGSRLAALAFQHPLPTQETLSNTSFAHPTIMTFEDLNFEESFDPYQYPTESSRRRVTYKAAEVHEKIMVQVAPYPIPGEPISPPKVPIKAKNNGKGKVKSSDDGKGTDEHEPESPKPKKKKGKKKRREARKVKCEIDGCNGTFFSNWELKRHQKNLHGIGDEIKSAVCPKCGRQFASRRKDSVDRHLELNACGKRNARKPPK